MVCLNCNFSHKVDMGIKIAWSVAPALNFHSIFSYFFRELCGKNWPTQFVLKVVLESVDILGGSVF